MKKLMTLFCILILLVSISIPTQAADGTEEKWPYVSDTAKLLSEEELSNLEQLASQISEQYQCGVYIYTVNDFATDIGNSSVYEAAKTVYTEHNFGLGEEKSGVMLLLSMKERDYSLIAYGYGNTAFTDSGKDELSKEFLSKFGQDDWYGGFTDYLNKSADMLKAAREVNQTQAGNGTGEKWPYVSDTAKLLSKEELSTLEQMASEISEQYQCGVYIYTVNDFVTDIGNSSVYEAAKTVYTKYNLGEEKSGVMLLLSMKERDYSLVAYGYGNTAFTDYGKDKLSKEFLNNFGQEDWYGGFTDYLNKSADMLKDARAGNPLDVDSNIIIRFFGFAVSIACGCLIAFSICGFIEWRMKTVKNKTKANEYVKADSIDIVAKEDSFLYTTETRVKIEKKSGGGGTTIDSSGFSGKSGKF